MKGFLADILWLNNLRILRWINDCSNRPNHIISHICFVSTIDALWADRSNIIRWYPPNRNWRCSYTLRQKDVLKSDLKTSLLNVNIIIFFSNYQTTRRLGDIASDALTCVIWKKIYLNCLAYTWSYDSIRCKLLNKCWGLLITEQ